MQSQQHKTKGKSITSQQYGRKHYAERRVEKEVAKYKLEKE